jgi:hypothetical protein
VEGCFAKDEMSLLCEQVQGAPFLRVGVAPAIGMRVYMQVGLVGRTRVRAGVSV